MQDKNGVLAGILAYLLWGLLPLYWKLLEDVGAEIVLAHRIIWSFIFMIFLILFSKTGHRFIDECKKIYHQKTTRRYIIIASIVITLNWLVFIWAVQNEFVVQSSLGYYINPLVSILLGVIFLRERLTKIQTVSCILAAVGVSYLTFSYGVFPWIALILAFSFGSYGLFKKLANINASFSLAIETMIVTPIALLFLLLYSGPMIGFTGNLTLNLLLIFCGVATAVPLLLFGHAVLKVSLSMIGFLQYIAPTLMLIIGVFVYDEPFTQAHFITFTLIWLSLVLFMTSSVLERKRIKYKI